MRLALVVLLAIACGGLLWACWKDALTPPESGLRWEMHTTGRAFVTARRAAYITTSTDPDYGRGISVTGWDGDSTFAWMVNHVTRIERKP